MGVVLREIMSLKYFLVKDVNDKLSGSFTIVFVLISIVITKTMIRIIFGVRFLLITFLKYRIAYRFNGCETAG